MEQDIDLPAIRIFSYAICGIFLVLPVMLLIGLPVLGFFRTMDRQVVGSMYSFGIILNYIVNVTMLLCLYRMNALSVHFRYAQAFFLGWVVTGIFSKVASWLWNTFTSERMPGILSGILFLLPGFLHMAGMAGVLSGMGSFCREMAKEKEEKTVMGLRKIFLSIQIVRLLLIRSGVAIVWMMYRSGRLGTGSPVVMVSVGSFLVIWIAGLVAYELVGFHICRNVWGILRNYYLHVRRSRMHRGKGG